MSEVDLKKLYHRAREVARNSYSPYSRFRVGAALLTSSGKIYVGTNVENASYGLTICAERVAISTAVAAGERKFEVMVIYCEGEKPVSPCGACRQFMAEFGNFEVHLICDGTRVIRTSVEALLPMGFGAKDLNT